MHNYQYSHRRPQRQAVLSQRLHRRLLWLLCTSSRTQAQRAY